MAAMVLTRRTTGRRRAPRATMPTPPPAIRGGATRGLWPPTAFFRVLLGVVFHMDENCHVEPLTRTAAALEREGAISTQLVVTGMGCPNCAARVRNSLVMVHRGAAAGGG